LSSGPQKTQYVGQVAKTSPPTGQKQVGYNMSAIVVKTSSISTPTVTKTSAMNMTTVAKTSTIVIFQIQVFFLNNMSSRRVSIYIPVYIFRLLMTNSELIVKIRIGHNAENIVCRFNNLCECLSKEKQIKYVQWLLCSVAATKLSSKFHQKVSGKFWHENL